MLTDLDHCSDYLTDDGLHISEGSVDNFKGNLVLASVNALLFRKLSRRDDLLTLTYLLIYMLQGHIYFLAKQHVPYKYQYNYIRICKQHLTPEKLCTSSRAKLFISFIKNINSL